MGDEDPGHRACNGGFEVLGQSTAASKPAGFSFHNPAALGNPKAFDRVGALDDSNVPVLESGGRFAQLVASIAPIGKDMAQPRVERPDGGQHLHGAIPVLDVGGVNAQPDQMALRVGDDVALAALDLLAGIEAARSTGLRGLHRLAIAPRMGLPRVRLSRARRQEECD